MVVQGNGQFRLKPVLHAGEVGLTATSITGQLVDSSTTNAISGAKGIVALEAKDASGIDRLIMQTTPDANGNFIFCPVPTGTYDVVAVLQATSGASTVAYAATVTSGVQPGNALGKIPMNAQASPNSQQGVITGVVSTGGSSGSISEDLVLSAQQQMTISSSNVQVTIPLAQQQSTLLSATTVGNGSCPANTDCVAYTLALPSALPYLGAFSTRRRYLYPDTWVQRELHSRCGSVPARLGIHRDLLTERADNLRPAGRNDSACTNVRLDCDGENHSLHRLPIALLKMLPTSLVHNPRGRLTTTHISPPLRSSVHIESGGL